MAVSSRLAKITSPINPANWMHLTLHSGKTKEHKPKLLGPDIFCWGGGLPREGVGAKKFGMSFETQGNQTFWRDNCDRP